MPQNLILGATLLIATIPGLALCEENKPPIFTEAQRVLLSQEAFKLLAKSNIIPLSPPATGPTDVAGIQRLTAEIYKLEKSEADDTEKKARFAAFRKMFYSIGKGDGRDLRKLGLDFSKEFWGKPNVAKVKRPGFSTPQTMIVGYSDVNTEVLAELLHKMLTRQTAVERRNSFGGELSPEWYMYPDGRLATDDALLISIDSDTGETTITPPAELNVRTIADLENLTLNPNNLFKSAEGGDRDFLFEQLVGLVESGLDKKGTPLFPEDVKPLLKSDYEKLRRYFKVKDDLLNTTESAIEAVLADERLGSGEQSKAKALLRDELALREALDAYCGAAYAEAMPAYRSQTASQFGPLPDPNALASELCKKFMSEQRVAKPEADAPPALPPQRQGEKQYSVRYEILSPGAVSVRYRNGLGGWDDKRMENHNDGIFKIEIELPVDDTAVITATALDRDAPISVWLYVEGKRVAVSTNHDGGGTVTCSGNLRSQER
jgi:hypothetical protein